MEQYNEILKLKTMLEEAGIVFDFYPRKELHDEWDGYQICYPADQGRVCSVIEGALTYGGLCDRLEIMGLLTKEERKDGTVKGWLTAEDVFARIKKHWEENYLNRTTSDELLKKCGLAFITSPEKERIAKNECTAK